jgi:hypothetical protein
MNLPMDAVLDFSERVPAVTLAAYAGRPNDDRHGVLAILVNNGRRVSSGTDLSQLLGKGNIVDGPALRWLAEQPEPRIWVSDGIVTGVGDQQAAALHREAIELVATAQIERVSDLETALALIVTGRRSFRS